MKAKEGEEVDDLMSVVNDKLNKASYLMEVKKKGPDEEGEEEGKEVSADVDLDEDATATTEKPKDPSQNEKEAVSHAVH